MLSLLAALLLAQPDGGTSESAPFSNAIYAACPDPGDAGLAERVDGGWFLPEVRAQRVSCLLAACEEDRKVRTQTEPKAPTWVWVVSTAADVALKAAAVITTWGITKAANAPPPQTPPP